MCVTDDSCENALSIKGYFVRVACLLVCLLAFYHILFFSAISLSFWLIVIGETMSCKTMNVHYKGEKERWFLVEIIYMYYVV